VLEETTIRFGGFRLDPATRSLKHEGSPVTLSPKTFDLLVYLALNPNQVVSKEELLAAVWPNSIVEESNLSQHVFLLRKALGSVGMGEPIVVTVPGKGYQFAAVVERPALKAMGHAMGHAMGGGQLLVHAVESITRVVVEEESDEDEPVRPELAGAGKRRGWLGRGWLGGAATGAAVVAVGCGLLLGWRWLHPKHTGHVDLVLAQIENDTGDADFDSTLNEALRIDLEQSPYLNLLSRSRIRETLAKMERATGERLTESLAREICERNNGQVVLRGAISQIGKSYVFLLSAESCVSNKPIASYTAEAASKEEVLKALDQAAGEIRRQLGESAVSLDKFQVPIATVSTASLEALRSYSEGDQNFNRGNMKTAALLYENAIELDVNFASAYKSLAWTYYDEGEYSRAAEFSKKAYDLRERTSERERLNIETTYNYLGIGDLEAAARSLKLYLDIYADSAGNWGNLCNVYTELGEYSLAIGAGEKAWQIDANSGFVADGLARAYERANRFADAKRVAHAAIAGGTEWELHSTLFQIAYAENDAANLKVEGELGRTNQSARLLLNDLGFAAAASGKLREAKEDFGKARQEALRDGNAEFADLAVRNLARVEIELGETTEAAATLSTLKDEGGGLNGAGRTQGEVAFLRAEAGDTRPAEHFVGTVGDGTNARNTILACCQLPILRALLALKAHKAAEAVELLEAARPYELRDFAVPYLRARAETEAGKLDAAAQDYRLILGNRGVDPIAPVYSLSHLELARVLALEKKTDEARSEYRAFLEAWKDADPEVKIAADARRELAQLR